jgi:hypothetical protein
MHLEQLYLAAKVDTDNGSVGVCEAAMHAVVHQTLDALVFMHR